MPDLVAGLGEIGMPMLQLLKHRNFMVEGVDSVLTPEFKFQDHYDMIHICFGYSDKFNDIVRNFRTMSDKIIIHSTVKPNTSKELGVIYSPIRGTHNDMFENLQWFSKYYSSSSFDLEFEKRFPNCVRVKDSTKLERTKIMDTTYYGMLIAFRKWVDENYPVYWAFSHELHQRYGNRPVMYNDGKSISGHCIVPNLDLLGDNLISDFIRRYG